MAGTHTPRPGCGRRRRGDIFGPVLADSPFIGFIPVHDLPAARTFYSGTLGLRVVGETPFALVLDAGGTMLRVKIGRAHV